MSACGVQAPVRKSQWPVLWGRSAANGGQLIHISGWAMRWHTRECLSAAWRTFKVAALECAFLRKQRATFPSILSIFKIYGHQWRGLTDLLTRLRSFTHSGPSFSRQVKLNWKIDHPYYPVQLSPVIALISFLHAFINEIFYSYRYFWRIMN